MKAFYEPDRHKQRACGANDAVGVVKGERERKAEILPGHFSPIAGASPCGFLLGVPRGAAKTSPTEAFLV